MGKCIGIDLGTTNSCVAIVDGGKQIVIANEEGNRTTPSVVAFTKDGDLVGQSAKRQATTNPSKTIFGTKRLIGRMFGDTAVQDMVKSSPFKIVEGLAKEALIEVDGESYSPVVISAKVLGKLKKAAEEYLGEEVTDAVVTVPAYFDDAQRQATKDAGKIAGLEVKRIINEPTAAALAYGLDLDKEEKVAVFDLGGGTFDVSILEIGDGVTEVLSTSGDTALGGELFDERIVNWLADEFKKESGIDLLNDSMALQRLKDEAEKAKKELSVAKSIDINVPFITADASGPKHLNITLSRAKLEALVEDLISKTIEPCKIAVEDSGLKIGDIDQVLLVGGMTRMPKVYETVKEFFNKEPSKGVNPDEVVATGAAIQGGVFTGEVNDILLLDVTPLSLSIETLGGVATKLIEKNTTVPVTKSQVFSTAVDNQPAVSIHVVQGEREMVVDNKTLGKFDLVDIPPAPRGVPQIEVSFDIDVNGILEVTAKDLGTGKEQSIKVESSSGLSSEEIDKMVKDAELNAEADKQRKELVEAKNNAETTIHSMKKFMKDHEDKVTDEESSKINDAIDKVESVLKSDSTKEDIEQAVTELNESFHPISQKVYQDIQTQQASQEPDTEAAAETQESSEG